MKLNIKKYFIKLIKEIIPVIIGVLIALIINNWNEGRKDKKYINKFYASLKKELKQTNEEIKNKIPHQYTLIDTLSFYEKNNTVSLYESLIRADGVKRPRIRVNYWKALSSSKIELLDYEQLSILSNIEEGKELLNLKLEKLLNFIYSVKTDNTDPDNKLKVKIMIQDLIVTEKDIQKEIEAILNN